MTGLRRKKAPHVLLLPALESTSTALTASREEKPSTHTHSRRSNILTNNNRSHALLATHNFRPTQPAKPRKQTRPIKPPNPRLDFPESAPASPEEKSGFFDPHDQGTSPLTWPRICKVLFNISHTDFGRSISDVTLRKRNEEPAYFSLLRLSTNRLRVTVRSRYGAL